MPEDDPQAQEPGAPNGHDLAGVEAATASLVVDDTSDGPQRPETGAQGNGDDVDWHVRVLIENGLALIPIKSKEEPPHEFKEPTVNDWPNQTPLTQEEAVSVLRGNQMGVGAMVGAGGFLDIDMDLKVLKATPEGRPVDLRFSMSDAGQMIVRRIPPTAFVFGRGEYTHSHALYRTAAPFITESIKTHDKRGIIELRGLSTKGEVRLQTVMPPSRHRRGSQERRVWASPSMRVARERGTIPQLPVLDDKALKELRRGLREGVAILYLAAAWPTGAAHEYSLALAGLLAKEGWPEDAAMSLIWEVKQLAGAGGRGEYNVLLARVADTYEKHKRGDAVTGWQTLVNHCGEGVLKYVCELLELDADDGVSDNSILLEIKSEDCRRSILHQLRDANLAFVTGNVATRVTTMPAPDILRYQSRFGIEVPATQPVMLTLGAIPFANLVNKHVPLHKNKRAPSGKIKRRSTEMTSGDANWLLKSNEFGSIQHDLHPLFGISPVPLVTPDGALVTRPGYNAPRAMWVAWSGGDLDVPDRPTEEEARAAVQKINDTLLRTFSFNEEWETDEARRGHVLEVDWKENGENEPPLNRVAAIAGLMTAVLRPNFITSPAIVITSPQARTGKNLLMDTLSHVLMGAKPVQVALGDRRDEHAKRIPHALSLNAPFLCFTNVDGRMESTDLEAFLTDGSVRIRLFGTTEGEREVFNRGVVGFTGNQNEMPLALLKRCLRIVLNAHAERPEERNFVGKEPPPVIALKRRKDTLSHVFTIARWWAQSRDALNDRVKDIPDGSFPEWTDMVRRPLFVLTGVDIDGTIQQAAEMSSEVSEERSLVLALWRWAKSRAWEAGENFARFTMAALRSDVLDYRDRRSEMSPEARDLFDLLDGDVHLARGPQVFGRRRLAPLDGRIICGIKVALTGKGKRAVTYVLQVVDRVELDKALDDAPAGTSEAKPITGDATSADAGGRGLPTKPPPEDEIPF